MKYFSLLLLSLLTLNSFADEVPTRVPSVLKGATVYRNAAELTHTAKASLDAGNNALIIEGISNNIDISSLQIGSDGMITIMSVEYATDYLKPAVKSALVKRLEDSLQSQNQLLSNIQVILKTDYELLELLKVGKEIRSGQAGISVADLVKLMDYYRTKTLEIQSEIALYKEKEKNIIELINKYRKQINEEEQKNTRTGGRLELQLNSASSGNYNFTVSYITQAASWNPYYDIRAESITKPLQLMYKARLVQSSGIDWKQVKLTLSTSTPNQHGNAPVFSSWFLGYINPVTIADNAGFRSNRFQSMAPSAALEQVVVAAGSSKKEAIGISDYVNTIDRELNVSFDISLPYDVPNNGKEQTVILKELQVPATYKFYGAPKLDNDAYLLAEVPEWEKLNLLPGEANIIFEGTYVGKTYIDPNSTSDTLNLTLGRDKRVVVKREKLADFSSVKFLGNNKKQLFTYEITVKNNKKEKLQMLLKDQMPLSTNKEIEVEILETAQGSLNPDNGVLTWKVDLAPGETKKFRISYSVKYPKDKVVNLTGA